MPQFLSTIDEVFVLPSIDRGPIILPGVPKNLPLTAAVRIGDSIRLVRPDGVVIETSVQGIESVAKGPFVPIMLEKNLPNSEVHVGSEVWHTPQPS